MLLAQVILLRPFLHFDCWFVRIHRLLFYRIVCLLLPVGKNVTLSLSLSRSGHVDFVNEDFPSSSCLWENACLVYGVIANQSMNKKETALFSIEWPFYSHFLLSINTFSRFLYYGTIIQYSQPSVNDLFGGRRFRCTTAGPRLAERR